jgi:hypothetical protein
MPRQRYDGPLCPADPTHGPLWGDRSPAPDGYGWTCPHVAHDGRPKRHVDGPSAPTRRRFKTTEIAA